MEKYDFENWNLVKQQTHLISQDIKIKEGEIRWCRFGVNIGNEIIGKGSKFVRPVLILKKFTSDVFFGCPLTTKIKQGNWYYNLEHQGVVRCVILNQARLLDRKRLEEKLYEVNLADLRKIKEAYCSLIMS